MRFLKNKIALASRAKSNSKNASQSKHTDNFYCSKSTSSSSEVSQNTSPASPFARRRLPGFSFTSEKVKVTKNIVINYGRAISGFALSNLSDPYWEVLIVNEKTDRKKFNEFVQKVKNTIGGICSFKAILVVTERDTEEVAIYKRIYKKLAEIFIKYFSVNWIIHGRMGHKDVYLKYRFKMLRRIRRPELFTYLKDSKDRNSHEAFGE